MTPFLHPIPIGPDLGVVGIDFGGSRRRGSWACRTSTRTTRARPSSSVAERSPCDPPLALGTVGDGGAEVEVTSLLRPLYATLTEPSLPPMFEQVKEAKRQFAHQVSRQPLTRGWSASFNLEFLAAKADDQMIDVWKMEDCLT